jgi:serine phosphatase RsbU (regulator of sigma subunit)
MTPRSTSTRTDPSPAPRGWILIVDDDPVSTLIARRILEGHGYVVDCRPDALSGLERAQGSPTPDVVLFDIEMPGMDGIEACRRLRALEGLDGVPAMLCSAQAKEQFLAEGLNAGANDYLEKPYSEVELVARVENLARMARYQQSLRDTLEQVRRNNEMLGLELEAARRVQGALLPTTLTPHPSLRSAVLYEPMVGVGGDFYDVSLSADGMVRLLVADVSGHGVFAALLAAFFKMGYQVYSDRESGPAAVLSAVHHELCRSLDSGHFVTALAAWLDPVTGRLRYASAGHAPALLRHTSAGRIERLLPTGPILGIMEESRFGEAEALLAPGDGLLLLTDGIIEASSGAGEPYGLKRVETVVRRNPPGQPGEMLQNLRIDLENHQETMILDDDYTALAVEWFPVQVPAGMHTETAADQSPDQPSNITNASLQVKSPVSKQSW